MHAWSDTKIFSTQLIFFEISWFIWCDSRDRIQKWVFEITWFKWFFHQTYKCDQNKFCWTRNLTSYPILCISYTVPSLSMLCVVACRKCDSRDTTVWLAWHSSTLNSNTYLYLAFEETNCNISNEKIKKILQIWQFLMFGPIWPKLTKVFDLWPLRP